MYNFKKMFAAFLVKAPRPYPELAKLVAYYGSRRNTPEVLYLGDSVLERISWSDKDKRTLDRMVAARLTDKMGLLSISHSAYHLKVYYHLLQILKVTDRKPRLVILPINMRSFSPQWNLNPAWQFEDEIDALKKYVETPGSKIPVLPEKADHVPPTEVERMVEVKYPFTELNYLGEFYDLIKDSPSMEDEKRYRKKQIYIFHYLYQLLPVNPRLLFLTKIIELLRELNINLLVYITPINYQGGNRYLGSDFIKLFQENVGVVRDILSPFLERGTVHFLDIGQLLSSEYFFNVDEATEHLNQHGREQVAKVIANEVLLMDIKRNGVYSL